MNLLYTFNCLKFNKLICNSRSSIIEEYVTLALQKLDPHIADASSRVNAWQTLLIVCQRVVTIIMGKYGALMVNQVAPL